MSAARKPAAVAAGARVAVVAPASNAKIERIEGGIAALRRHGFQVIPFPHATGKSAPYFSGTAEERLADLHEAFADPDIEAIFCTRGGYGSNYLLEDLDLELIAKHPKPLFGYSDLTVVQTWLLDELGLVGFHGPMAAADFYREDGVDEASFSDALNGVKVTAGVPQGLRILKPGRAQGVMHGGCLSMLVSTLGTRFAPQTEGRLLFIEDVGAKPYQIDRMLRQMVLAGKFDGVTGFIFGEMLECASPNTSPDLLDQVILRVLDWFDGPIAIGLRSGHVSRGNVTLPMGIEAEIVAEEEPVLRYLESAVD
ncbi:muramoyltetrapeptide carboxypeptidase [Silvibacterium bohemicum]|uniref:Muramoyltetrapeptide carboxypeptidase n=1 Tax=Silvibacterium bohemicum TaxID=1577686 RepID=A0A841JTY1_9BACT|nr:LD-carboxypeptidase [Silvibacterium bohemicum]MBB6142431.1 muramoyltetrapeptide carboxypeptidase [Silvibacterium bohemicum]